MTTETALPAKTGGAVFCVLWYIEHWKIKGPELEKHIVLDAF